MKKYVLVGTGVRGIASYIRPLIKDFKDCVNLCAVYDINEKRAREAVRMEKADNIKVYTDFDEMIKTEKPDTVIITTKDCVHDVYAVRAMELGCDVISEKPLTTDEVKFNSIYECMLRTGKNVTVTFNMRFHPLYSFVKDLMMKNVIGRPLNVHFEWMLDTSHGADYFRRWHRNRENSGSLIIHKATHHFDIINWVIDQRPVKVNAFGLRGFYGQENGGFDGVRCSECPKRDECKYFFDIINGEPHFKKLYKECEDLDGYLRDRCIFSHLIDIEDTMSVNILYDKGTVCSYSLVAHCPYEGSQFSINGTDGRMEVKSFYNPESKEHEKYVKVYHRDGTVDTYTDFNRNTGEKVFEGGHGGADPAMRDMLFRGGKEDKLCQVAGIEDAAMSIGIGIASNKSLRDNEAVYVKELFDFTK